MGGSSTVSINNPRINEIQVQKSAYGTPIALPYGRCRLSINLGWYADFTAVAHTDKESSGGKGGGSVTTKTTTYSYFAAIIMFIGEKIKNVRAVFRDKEVFVDGGTYIATVSAAPGDLGDVIPGDPVYLFDAGSLNGSYIALTVGSNFFTIAVPSNTPTVVSDPVKFSPYPKTSFPFPPGKNGTLNYTANQSALGTLGLSLKLGDTGQSVWPYLSTNHPDQAIGYSQTAYLYSPSYQLNDSAGLQNHSLEIDGLLQMPGLPDADPSEVVEDLLTNSSYGVSGWPAGLIGDLTEFSNYCRANNLLISPCYDTQRQASEVLQEIVQGVNCEIVWSEGLFKVRSYGDEAATANNATFTPNMAPLFDLTDDDFQPDEGDDPISVDRTQAADAFNSVQLEFLNRAHQYNPEPIIAFDQASIEADKLRKKDPIALHMFCEASIARKAVQLILQRLVYVRRRYAFRLGWNYCMLEPMDLVTVTDLGLGLNKKLVRLKSIEEDEDGYLSCEAEDVELGTASAFTYETQEAQGWVNDQNADPGDTLPPVFINPPSTFTNGALELWAALAGSSANWGGCEIWASFSDSNYKRIGIVYGPSRFGLSTAMLAAGSDPDTTNTLSVDLGLSLGTMDSANQDDADALVPLCWLGGEMLAYRDATLTGPNEYDLDYLRRGQYGTASTSHPSGTSFVRLDDAVFRYPYQSGQIGKTLYVKLTSFNKYKLQSQLLEDVMAYTIVLNPDNPIPDQVTNVALTTPFESTYFNISWPAADRATSYTVRVYASDGTTLLRTATSSATAFTYLLGDAEDDGDVERTYKITVTSSNASGDAPPSAQLTVSNSAPPAPTGLTHTGSGASVDIDWNTVSVSDRAGYYGYYSTVSGFNPATGGGTQFYDGTISQATLSGLTPGTMYYVRVAAYDTWSNDPAYLNFSSQYSFTA